MGVPQFRDATLFLRRTTICQNSNFCNQSVESHLFKVFLQTSVLPYAIQLLPQIFPFLLLVIKTWSFHISHMLFILCMIHYPFQHHQSMPAAHNLLVFAVKTYISVGSTASVQFFLPYYTILFFLHLPLLPLCLLIIFIFSLATLISSVFSCFIPSAYNLTLPSFFFLLSLSFTTSFSLPLHLQSFGVCCHLLLLPLSPTLHAVRISL